MLAPAQPPRMSNDEKGRVARPVWKTGEWEKVARPAGPAGRDGRRPVGRPAQPAGRPAGRPGRLANSAGQPARLAGRPGRPAARPGRPSGRPARLGEHESHSSLTVVSQ